MEAENTREQTKDTVSGSSSGVCELTNQSRLVIWKGAFKNSKKLKQ